MSKVDAMRAIRDARFAEAARRPATPAPARARVATPAPEAPAVAATSAPAAAEGLCGHRNMGGRSCTRETDHQKTGTKSHRYA